ncbi:ABC transporter permease [Kurthia gibsonii]|uniref:ABC transporter permease n=1 Tax=Kurthia gibsonii TaxID=33946 RepID=UPI0031B72AF3
MTLFSLARKNIRRNLSQYSLYIASMVFSIAIYFTFVTMKYNETITGEVEASKKIASIMSSSSVVLLVFVTIFIFYSNAFFMKKRKKEVGLYALLGVRKRQIGFLLFFENLLLGIISLIFGIFFGFLASKLFLWVLLKMMDYQAVAHFTLSIDAVINTVCVFLILFLITSIQGYRVVYRFQLIELFHAEKQGEKVPKPNVWLALLGASLVGVGYYIALANMMTSPVWKYLSAAAPLIILACVIIGTYLIFHSFIGYCLKMIKKSEGFIWQNLRLLTVSQLLYRIRGNAQTLTIITVLSATTITAGGAVFGLYYNTKSTVQQADPFTYMYVETKNTPKLNQKDEAFKILYTEFDAKELSDAFGPYGKRNYTVMAVDTYNQLARLLDKPTVEVAGKEAIIIDPSYDERYSPDYKEKQLDAMKVKQSLRLKDVTKENVLNSSIAYTTLIVTPDVFKQLQNTSEKMTVHAVIEPNLTVVEAKKIQDKMPEDARFSSYPIDVKQNMESVGIILFVGSFLGFVFLLATGSIIYFKILTEAEADKGQFMILHKMGISMKSMKQSIAAQVGVIFCVPLLVGLIHSAVALKAISSVLNMNIFVPVCIWMGIYSVIYAVYYAFTVRAYTTIMKRTIRSEG